MNLSRLQLVQHSLHTIVETLSPQDQVVFIEFETNARVILTATKMDKSGKTKAKRAIDNLEDKGSTNIWGALQLGVEQAKSLASSQSNIALLLFTDGQPNTNPPSGIIPSLQELLSGTDASFSISTFSFGYEIDSILMESIARLGHGVYGYCPDATMVGTIFINFLANIMNTLTQKAIVEVRAKKYHGKQEISLYSKKSQNIFLEIPKCEVEKITLRIPCTLR